MNIVIIEMRSTVGQFSAGDTYAFARPEAERLIKAGVAVLHEPRPTPAPASTAATIAAEAKRAPRKIRTKG